MPFQKSSWIMNSNLWRREDPDSLIKIEFTHYEFTHSERSSGTRSRIDRVYTDVKTRLST